MSMLFKAGRMVVCTQGALKTLRKDLNCIMPKNASTKKKVPFDLVYYEAYVNIKDAYMREKYIKTQYGRNYLSKVLSNFFISKNFLG